MHRARPSTRQLTDYVRALGDTDPTISTRDIAEAVHRVFGYEPEPATEPLGLRTSFERNGPPPEPFIVMHPDDAAAIRRGDLDE